MQLRFALLTVTSSQQDLHPQVCAHAGRTMKTGHAREGMPCCGEFDVMGASGALAAPRR
jgi:hypothetical protein